MPETILAMLQSRLSYLEPGARRLLRAASIFGQTFWRGGVRMLLRGSPVPAPTPNPDAGAIATADTLDAAGAVEQTVVESFQTGRGRVDRSEAERSGDNAGVEDRAGDGNGVDGSGDPGEPASAPFARADGEHDSEIDGWLAILCEAEIIERHRDSRLPGDIQYGFRHGLLREATYSLLTPPDLRLGHKLAGRFLAAAGPLVADPLALGDHFRLGGELEAAATYYLRAAEQALAGNDLIGALDRAERGVSCGVGGELLGSLFALQAVVHFWRGEWAAANQKARFATALVPHGHFRWSHPMRASFYMLFGRPSRPLAQVPIATAVPAAPLQVQLPLEPQPASDHSGPQGGGQGASGAS